MALRGAFPYLTIAISFIHCLEKEGVYSLGEMVNVYMDSNLVQMSVEDYLDLKAMEFGFKDYEDMKKFGYVIDGYENY